MRSSVRGGRARSRTWGVAAAGLLLLCTAGCQPWGKPGPEEVAPDQITDFKTLYGANCSGCHGAEGRNGPGRILNDALYLAIIPRKTLQQTIENGRPATAMPPFARSQGGPLTPKQITALVNGIESQWRGPVDAGGSLPSYRATVSGDAGHGAQLFNTNCSMCHGPKAPIGSVTDRYFLSLVSNQVLRTSIIVGRPDLGMPDYRTLKMGHALSEQDIADLVAYLASQRPAEASAALINDSGTGQAGQGAKGNEGSGYGPGSPRQQKNEGNQYRGSSQRGVK